MSWAGRRHNFMNCTYTFSRTNWGIHPLNKPSLRMVAAEATKCAAAAMPDPNSLKCNNALSLNDDDDNVRTKDLVSDLGLSVARPT